MAELSQHPDVVDLSEYAEGLLDDSRRAAVESHVRGCPDCSQTLADLAALPSALADAPIPPMPADVAQRLDQAIATESQIRASGWSGTARVTPLRPRRRWLAPVVAAAAVVGAVAIAVPVLNQQSGDDSAGGTSTAADEGASREDLSEDGGAPPPDMPAPNAEAVPELSSESFGRDVIDAFYTGSRELRASKQALSSDIPSADYYRDTLATVDDLCDRSSAPGGTVDAVIYDDEPARLLRRESGNTVDAIAFTCDVGEPTLLDAATLRPRS